jgi:hypothetical protein
MVTLAGAFRHTVYPGTATNYLLTGVLPVTDRTCR